MAGAAALALSAGAAVAQDASPTTISPDASNSRLPTVEVLEQGDVRYITGGIGDEGKARTMQLGRDMNLQIVFAQAPSGQYVADVDVAIADRNGNEVLSLDAADPLLYVQLPPGNYRVTASAGGRSMTRSIDIPAQGRETQYFHWSQG